MNLEGSLDSVKNGIVYGWAMNGLSPSANVTVILLIDSKPVIELRADAFRLDLKQAGKGDGNVAFELPIPREYRDGKPHRYSVLEKSSRTPLYGSDQEYILSTPYGPAEYDNDAPWLDSSDFRFYEKLNSFSDGGKITETQRQQLEYFRENGFLHLRSAIDSSLIDNLLQDIEIAWKEMPPLYVQNPLLEKPTLIGEVCKMSNVRALRNRYLDFHNLSEAAAEIMCDRSISNFISLYFDEPIIAMQSLLFEVGTEQGSHQDFPYVHTNKPPFLAGAWVALEDVHENAGPLFYYPKSHRLIDKYVFEDGSVFAFGHGSHIERYQAYLKKKCVETGLECIEFYPKKGDVLIWHSALVHGGSIRKEQMRTRKSIVSHYTALSAYPVDRRNSGIPPHLIERNSCRYYAWDYPGHIEGCFELKP